MSDHKIHEVRKRQNVMWFRDGSAVDLSEMYPSVRERSDTSRQREFERACDMDKYNFYKKSANRFAFWRKWVWV